MRPGRGATMSESRAGHDDDVYLRQFGVEPKLKRAIGYISSSLFAIAFQGPTTGALLITGATLFFGGPAFIWSIPLIFLFQLLVALSWAAILLLGHVHQPLSVLFTTGGVEAKGSYIVPFLIVVALVITQFVGFETAGTFAEETRNSRVSPARAIVTALAGACLFVFVFDFALILSLPDVAKGMAEPEGVIPATLNENLGSFGAKAFLIAAFVAVSSTSIATLAAIVRMMYGMARDNQLPGSRFLTRLAGNGEPVICIVVAALLSMVPLLFVQQIPVLIAAITFMILIPYFLVLASLIRRRLAGWPTTDAPFKLGAAGTPLAVIGIVWVGFVAIDAAWPRAATNPNLGSFPILEEAFVVTAVLGALWWFLVLRRRVKQPVGPDAPIGAEVTRAALR